MIVRVIIIVKNDLHALLTVLFKTIALKLFSICKNGVKLVVTKRVSFGTTAPTVKARQSKRSSDHL